MALDILLDPDTFDLRPVNLLVDDEDDDRGDEVTQQRVRRRMLTFLGEWLLDQTVGVPYMAWTQASPPPTTVIASLLTAEIEQVPRVERVERMAVTFDPDTQRVSVTCRVVLVNGSTAFVRVLPFGVLGGKAPVLEASL